MNTISTPFTPGERLLQTRVDALTALLRQVRACRIPGGPVQTIHGLVEMEPCWSISGLTALLPHLDQLLTDSASEPSETPGQEGGSLCL